MRCHNVHKHETFRFATTEERSGGPCDTPAFSSPRTLMHASQWSRTGGEYWGAESRARLLGVAGADIPGQEGRCAWGLQSCTACIEAAAACALRVLCPAAVAIGAGDWAVGMGGGAGVGGGGAVHTTRITLWPLRSGYTSAKPIRDVARLAAGCTCAQQGVRLGVADPLRHGSRVHRLSHATDETHIERSRPPDAGQQSPRLTPSPHAGGNLERAAGAERCGATPRDSCWRDRAQVHS